MADSPQQSRALAIQGALEAAAPSFTANLPANIPVKKFVRVVQDAIRRNRELLECTPASVIDACSKAAADGLVLDGREAALVIYNKREKDRQTGKWETVAREAQYIPMVAGLRRRIFNSGMVSVLTVSVVYQAELDAGAFEYQEGTEPRLIHRPLLVGDLGPPVAAYSVVTMAGGHRSVEVMRWSEIMAIARRQSKNTDREGNLAGIWKTDTIEMAKKTVLRRHSKQLPFDSETAQMFGRVDDLYRSEGDEIEHDGEDAPPAAPAKRAGAGREKLRQARQQASQDKGSPPVEDAEVVEDHDPETGEIPMDADRDAPAADDADRF